MKEIEKKYKILFGPKSNLPSFSWVSSDIFDELKEEIKFICFKNYHEIFKHKKINLIFIVKYPPPFWFITAAILMNIKLIYIPVDFLGSEYQIKKNSIKIRLIQNIFLHNLKLKKKLSKYTKYTFLINHYNKYPIERNNKTKKMILWVGHIEYIPVLIDHLNDFDYKGFGYDLTLLTDIYNIKNKIDFLKQNIKNINIKFIDRDTININNFTFSNWSERKYKESMKNCAFAVDFKEDSFHHQVKPPTKSQVYIANRVPLGINKNSSINDYFTSLDINLPDYKNLNFLISSAYTKSVSNHSKRLNKLISKSTVVQNYRKIVFDLIS